MLKPARQTLAPVMESSTNQADFSTAKIEEMVEKKVEEILAVRAVSEQSRQMQVRELNEQVQRRLEMLEQRIEGTEDARAEGLSYLLMAKQHQARGEDASALKMYKLALPHFPHNEKLTGKIAALKERVQGKTRGSHVFTGAVSPPGKGRFGSMLSLKKAPPKTLGKRQSEDFDADYQDQAGGDGFSSDEDVSRPRPKKRATAKSLTRGEIEFDAMDCDNPTVSPRSIHLLSIINSRDVSQIKLLKGVGAKKAEAIVDCLCEMDQTPDAGCVSDQPQFQVHTLAELSTLKGVGLKTVENMRTGVLV